MKRQEIWVLDGYATATATDTLFALPVLQQNRLRQISPDLTKRKLYAGFIAPGALIDRLFVEFIFRREGSEIARVPFYWRGANNATYSGDLIQNRPEFAPSLPFSVETGVDKFDYPPLSGPEARHWQTFDLIGTATPPEILTMFPTAMNLEADQVECVGGIQVESVSGNAMRIVWGVVSEEP